jgi:hypothetical protein
MEARLKLREPIRISVDSLGMSPGTNDASGRAGGNTQFQQADIAVEVAITPRIRARDVVDLKLRIELSNVNAEQGPDGPTAQVSAPSISGISVDEGRICLLGGILEQAGVPHRSEQNTGKHGDNIVFLLMPHVIRTP